TRVEWSHRLRGHLWVAMPVNILIASRSHRRHVAICHHADATIVQLANAGWRAERRLARHRVATLYYHAETSANVTAGETLRGDIAMAVHGVESRTIGRDE